jgi:hypothetical protein
LLKTLKLLQGSRKTQLTSSKKHWININIGLDCAACNSRKKVQIEKLKDCMCKEWNSQKPS